MVWLLFVYLVVFVWIALNINDLLNLFMESFLDFVLQTF